MLSICIIGSQARRTADILSDQDVLLVGTSSEILKHAEDEWSSDGWNASVFDRPAFDRLAQVGSLFIQHVKQEGKCASRSTCSAENLTARLRRMYDLSTTSRTLVKRLRYDWTASNRLLTTMVRTL